MLNRENLNRHRIELYIKGEEEIYIVQIRRIEERHLSNRIIQRSGRKEEINEGEKEGNEKEGL